MKHLVIGVTIGSMSLGLIPVKTHAEDLPSINQAARSTKSGRTAVTDNINRAWPHLIDTVINSGQDFDFIDGFAQAIGLPGPLSAKRVHVSIQDGVGNNDERDVHIILTTDASGNGLKRPMCIYFHRGRGTKHDLKLRYFKISLNGELEQAITLQNKRDDKGQNIRESRERIEENIKDPEVQKAFKVERVYWLRDWLKKQQGTTPAASTTPTAL